MAYDSLQFQLRRGSVENENRLDSEVKKFTDAVEKTEEMCIGQGSAFVILVAFNNLMQPDANI